MIENTTALGDAVPLPDPDMDGIEIVPDEPGMGDDDEVLLDELPDSDEPDLVPVLKHTDNIAAVMSPSVRRSVVNDVLAAVQSDDNARAEWLETYKQAIDLLGFKFETVTEPWDGAASTTHPMLAEAVVAFQARAIKTLFPASGPVKAKILGPHTPFKLKAAARAVNELNNIMTKKRFFRTELEKALFVCGLSGSGFVKTWRDDLTNQPRVAAVSPEDLILSPDASDVTDAARVCHVLRRHSYEIKESQAQGVYISDAELHERAPTDPGPTTPHTVDVGEAKDEISGMDSTQDQRHVLHEVALRLRLSDYAPELAQYDDPAGVPLPYLLTYDAETGEMLALYRNWEEFDPAREPLQTITQFQYIVSHLSPYGIGLMHLIGNTTEGVTAILRDLINAGTLANLQGGFKTRGLRTRNENTPLRPGEFRDVDVASGKIADNIYPINFREPSNTLLTLLQGMEAKGAQLATVSNARLEEMPHNAASFAVLAVLEREIEPQAAVHIRLHAAFTHMIQQIAAIVRDGAPDYSYDTDGDDALDEPGLRRSDFSTAEFVPVSNPNEASAGAKLMKLQVVMQLVDKFPQEFDTANVVRYSLGLMGEPDFEQLLKNQEQAQLLDPISENMNLLLGKPIKAFMEQDHEAHLRVHMAAMQDPKIQEIVGQSPQAQALMAAAQAHIAEHVAFNYRRQMERMLGVPLPPPGQPLPPEQEAKLSSIAADAAEQLAGLHQKEEQLKKAQDPVFQMQMQETQNDTLRVQAELEDKRGRRLIDIARLLIEADSKEAKIDLDFIKSIADMLQTARSNQQRVKDGE
jgi:hypothetical protein